MAALVSRRVRKAQPQPGHALLIDWNNPITRDMTMCLSLADAAYGYTSYGQTYFAYSTGQQSNTPQGTGGTCSSAALCTVTSNGVINSPNYSLFAFGSCTSSSVIQSSLDMDNGVQRYFQFRIANGKADFIPFNTSAAVTGQATSPVALTVAEMSRGFTMGATASPTRTAVFQNGVVTAATPTSMITPGTNVPVAVGARLSNSQPWATGGLMLVATWTRTLTDAEMQSLADNPWQLFKPQPMRKLYMVSPAASGNGTATVTGVSAASNTGTVTASGDGTASVSGVSAASSTGNLTASGDASATVTGVSVASSTGTIAGIGDATTNVTGVSAASGTGSVTASGDGTASVSGVSAATAVGNIIASAGGNATASVGSVSATSGVGSIAASGDGTATVGGVSAASGTGSMTASGAAAGIIAGLQVSAALGTITATGTTGSVTAYIQGIAAATAVGNIAATGTRTTIEVNVTEDMVCRVVRSYIKSIAPTLPTVRTPVNRASMPNGAFVSFTPGLRRPLSTNVSSNDANSRTVRRPEQMSFQIDCYGAGSAELAETLNVLYRDQYACDLFANSGLEIVPLYAGDIQQAPFVNDADQYEDRYTFEIELQVNSSIIVPLQSCNILGIDLVSVDANFPPT